MKTTGGLVLSYDAVIRTSLGDLASLLPDRPYPRQIIVLKGTQDICKLTPAQTATPRGLVDEAQTRGFSSYCLLLREAERGNEALCVQLLDKAGVAAAHIDGTLGDTEMIVSGVDLMAKVYTAQELKVLRRGDSYD